MNFALLWSTFCLKNFWCRIFFCFAKGGPKGKKVFQAEKNIFPKVAQIDICTILSNFWKKKFFLFGRLFGKKNWFLKKKVFPKSCLKWRKIHFEQLRAKKIFPPIIRISSTSLHPTTQNQYIFINPRERVFWFIICILCPNKKKPKEKFKNKMKRKSGDCAGCEPAPMRHGTHNKNEVIHIEPMIFCACCYIYSFLCLIENHLLIRTVLLSGGLHHPRDSKFLKKSKNGKMFSD